MPSSIDIYNQISYHLKNLIRAYKKCEHYFNLPCADDYIRQHFSELMTQFKFDIVVILGEDHAQQLLETIDYRELIGHLDQN